MQCSMPQAKEVAGVKLAFAVSLRMGIDDESEKKSARAGAWADF